MSLNKNHSSSNVGKVGGDGDKQNKLQNKLQISWNISGTINVFSH